MIPSPGPGQYTRLLLLTGTLLFLLGLVNGARIQLFHNPRMALSAHLAAVQNGLVLLIFGLMWQHVRLSIRQAAWCYWLSVYGLYGIWISLVLAALLGTSSATPIAGAGFTATAMHEAVVNLILYSSSSSIAIATTQILIGLVINSSEKA